MEDDKKANLDKFVEKTKAIMSINTLTQEIVNEFIDRVYIYQAEKIDGKRHQNVEIHYKGVGILRQLMPEEFEKDFQARIKKSRKEKTA